MEGPIGGRMEEKKDILYSIEKRGEEAMEKEECDYSGEGSGKQGERKEEGWGRGEKVLGMR